SHNGDGVGSWSGRGDLNPRPPEPHLRVCLGTYADISFPEHLTSVPTCLHIRENARSRRALDAGTAAYSSLHPVTEPEGESRPGASGAREWRRLVVVRRKIHRN